MRVLQIRRLLDGDAMAALPARYSPHVDRMMSEGAWADRLAAIAPEPRRAMDAVVGEVLRDLYTPAQLDVLVRVDEINRTARGGNP